MEGEEGGSGDGAGRGAVIAAALGGAAVVLLLGIVAWLVMRARRGRRESAQKHSAFPATKGGTESAHMAYHPQVPPTPRCAVLCHASCCTCELFQSRTDGHIGA